MVRAENRISVRLTSELLDKIQQWKSYGYHASDIVRHALALLPGSPDQLQTVQGKIKPLPDRALQIELKDEKGALKALQEW